MTEPLFLALLDMDHAAHGGVRRGDPCAPSYEPLRAAGSSSLRSADLAAVFTRYDGWVLGAAIWCVVALQLRHDSEVCACVAPAFVLFTLLTVAGPLRWLAYNQHFFHDPLDFMRGPYSAAAIEKKTTAARRAALSRLAQSRLGADLLHPHRAGRRGGLGDRLCC